VRRKEERKESRDKEGRYKYSQKRQTEANRQTNIKFITVNKSLIAMAICTATSNIKRYLFVEPYWDKNSSHNRSEESQRPTVAITRTTISELKTI
jgi:hypothetical protein